MKVGFGCDHTAIDLKKELMEYMTEKGYECVDYGDVSSSRLMLNARSTFLRISLSR